LAAGQRPTAYQLFDNQLSFQNFCDSFVYDFFRNIGSPVLEVEVSMLNLYQAVEDATMMWSYEVNKHHARNILIDLLGTSTGSMSGSENSFVTSNSTEFARKLTIQYAAEVGANSPYPTYTGSIRLVPGQQNYDLLAYITGTHPTFNAGNVQIRKIHHYNPVTTYRFFDSQSFINYIGNEFNFASYSPETVYYLLPVWEDILRGNMLEQQANVRRSQYSFEIKGFILKLFPVPIRDLNLFFEYSTIKDPTIGIGLSGSKGVVSNFSNAAFGFIGFDSINSIGKTWIQKYAMALGKQMLANIRGKYNNLPIPNGELSLNWQQLQAQADREIENLLQDLKETLEILSYKNIMAEKDEIQTLAIKEWARLPKFIYRSR
jgi:hypothetical protein